MTAQITTGAVVAGPAPSPRPGKLTEVPGGRVVLRPRPDRPDRLRPDGRHGNMADMGSLMLLDTASLYYRAFYGMPDTVTAPDGTPVNAIRGLLDAIARLVRASARAGWWPAWTPTGGRPSGSRRSPVQGPPAGRRRRRGVPPGLAVQIPLIAEVLTRPGWPWPGRPATRPTTSSATLAARATRPVDVVTGDRDLFQLVDDARGVRVLYTVRGLINLEVIDEAAVSAKKYDIPGRAYADFAALRGDPSDGLPGVPGVGEKTAAALIRTFGSIEPQGRAGHGPRRLPARQPQEARDGPGLPGHRPVGRQGGRPTSRCRRHRRRRCPPCRRTRSC